MKKLIVLVVLIACVSIVCIVPTVSSYATHITIGQGNIQANISANSGVGDLDYNRLQEIQQIAGFLQNALENNSEVSSTIYEYFYTRPTSGTALDSTGINYAPEVNKELLDATGIDVKGKYSWRIYRANRSDNSRGGEYNIFIANADISVMNAGDAIDFVLRYRTVADEWVYAKSNVISAVVDKIDIINRINGDENNGFKIIEHLEMSQGVLKPIK